MENIKTIINAEPFQIVCIEVDKKDKFFIALGKYRYPHMYDSYEDALDEIDNKTWEMIGFYMEVFMNYLTNKDKNDGCNEKNN